MKKVGIVSCYFQKNYGSMLQAYALQEFLDINGIPNETVSIDDNRDFKNGKKKYYIKQFLKFNYKFIFAKFGMIKLKILAKLNKKLKRNINERNKKYNEFKRMFNLSRSSNDYKDLTRLATENYSNVIVGSDQLWLPVNVYADYYTLNWVPDSINKISYSTSFGFSVIDKKYNDLYKIFLKRINHLSVREQSGKEICNKLNVTSTIVADPTLLLSKNEWDNLCTPAKIIDGKYIVCYFLGTNIEHRKFAERLKEKTGFKIISLNHADEYVKYSDIYADETPYNIGPKEFLNLIKNAEYVLTDSFHCSVFSILYHKDFFCFRRYKNNSVISTNSRIDSLLNILGVPNNRILTGLENVEDVICNPIDFEKVEINLEKFRTFSRKWLLDSIEMRPISKCVSIDSKDECTGCTACANICPKKAISMERDKEGFLYPVINKEKCVECGLCKKVCPILNRRSKEFKQKGFIFQYNNDKIRLESTSGGFFTAISEEVINASGTVYGVAFDENFNVKHMRVTALEDLYKFRNSKYVQSDPNTTYSQVLKDLKDGLLVCYSGTACQIEGLKNYLQKDYDNLITVDVICRSVPSPLLWKKYYEMRNSDTKTVKFRDKIYGYKYSNLTFRNSKKITYKNGIDTDQYLRAFFSNISSRPSCYNCKFKTQIHAADFTIWDCFEVDKYSKDFDDDKGTTRILLNSNKAIALFDKIKDKHKTKEVDVNNLISNFHQMFNPIKYNSKRTDFFKDLNNDQTNKVLNKYFSIGMKNRIEKYSRLFLIKIGLYKPLIRIGKKIRRRK